MNCIAAYKYVDIFAISTKSCRFALEISACAHCDAFISLIIKIEIKTKKYERGLENCRI